MIRAFTVSQEVVEYLDVSEMFGPTIQGEGPSAGTPALFLRLGRCNLDCDWCDTPYTWDWKGKNGKVYNKAEEVEKMCVNSVADSINTFNENLMLVVTGGEPLIQSTSLKTLLNKFPGRRIEIETNGTRPAIDADVDYNVSPKLSGSGVSRQKAWRTGAIESLNESMRANWKFVITNEQDLNEVDEFVEQYDISPYRVWLMPEGRDAQTINAGLRTLAQPTIDRGYRLTGRQHVVIWGDTRGH